jgi:hypothetical protein
MVRIKTGAGRYSPLVMNSGVRNRTKGALVAWEFGVLWMNVDSLGKAAYRYKENTQNM